MIPQGQTKKDNVCFAPYDIDGDGQLDFAVGADWQPANTKSGGTIQWITGGKNPAEPWKLHPIGEYPTTHRMNFADLDGDGRQELIVSPLMGKDTHAAQFCRAWHAAVGRFKIPADPVKGPWKPEVICDDVHVTHNFQVTDFNGDGKPDILLVSFEGVHLLERAGRRQVEADAHRRRQPGNEAQQGCQRNQARQAGRRRRLHRHDRALARASGRRLYAARQPRPAPANGSGSGTSSTKT